MSSTSWTNTNGGDWITVSDWSAGVPTGGSLGTDAVISLAGTYTVTLAAAEVDAAHSLNVSVATVTTSMLGNASLTLGSTTGSGNTLTGTGALTNKGTFDLDTAAGAGGGSLLAGAVTNSGTMTIGNTGLTSAVGTAPAPVGFASLTNSASSTFTTAGSSNGAVTVNVTGAVSNSGTMSIGAHTSLNLTGTGKTFTEAGSSTTTVSGTLSTTNLSVSGGTFTLSSGGTLIESGTLTVSSTGTVDVSAADGVTTIFANVAGGMLTGTNVVTGSGTLDLPTGVTKLGGSLTVSGTTSHVNAGGSALGTGLTEIVSGGALKLNAGVSSSNFGTGTSLTVDAGANLTLDSLSSLSETGTLTIDGTATNAGTLTASSIAVSGGTLKLNPTFTLGGGTTVDGTGGGLLQLVAGNGTPSNAPIILGTTASAGNFNNFATVTVVSGTWNVQSHVAALAGATLTGDSASSLTFTDATGAVPSVDLSGVSKFGKINLANGTNFFSVSNNTLLGGSLTIDGGTGPDTIDASNVTATGRTLTFFAGAGSTGDSLIGGTENDVVKGRDAALTGGSWSGGAGSNTLTVTFVAGGALDLTGVSGFSTINLFATPVIGGISETVTLDASTLSVPIVTINGTSSNVANTINASSVVDTGATGSPSKTLVFNGGKATDTFTGGTEKDVVRVAGTEVGTLNGGATGGANSLFLTSASASPAVDLTHVSNFGSITLAATGADVVNINDTTLLNTTATSRVTFTDGNGGTTFNSTATGGFLLFNAGTGLDAFNGSSEADAVRVASAHLNDTLDGGGGNDILTLTTAAGTSAAHASLTNVSNFETINLASGANFIDIGAGTLAGSSSATPLTINGTTSTDTISVTGGSSGEALLYKVGSGLNTFTSSGNEDDTLNLTAAALSATTTTPTIKNSSFIAGNSLNNVLNVTTAGAVDLTHEANFETINLAAGTNFIKAGTFELSGATLSAANVVGVTNNNTLTLQDAGTGLDLTNISGINTLNLFVNGGNTVTHVHTPLTINDGAGTTTGNSVSVDNGVTGTVTYVIRTNADSFTGGTTEDDVVEISGSNLGTQTGTLTGSSGGNNTLVLTSAGELSLPANHVTNFATIQLAAGSSSVTVGATAFVGTGLTIKDGVSGNNVIDASTDTAVGDTLTYNATAGQDFFLGGAENDTVNVAAARVGTDMLIGGTGTNVLNLTTLGSANLIGVRNFSAINLFGGNGNSAVTVSGGTLFSSLHSGTVSINAATTGSGTDTVFAGGGASGESLTYVAQKRATVYNAGPQTDIFKFTFTVAAGASLESIANFNPNNDHLSFDNTNFGLGGTSGANVGAAHIGSLTNGTVSGSNQFAYDKSTGNLFYSADGVSEQKIAVMTTKPTLTAADFFVS